ncbi:hypothetical protein, partial [Chromobacterium haemolyticum]|uniref:hypothetical protein n=1 Tax=Chromobacterium haemolyticum TaxID=394935 RepID=UPI001962CE39
MFEFFLHFSGVSKLKVDFTPQMSLKNDDPRRCGWSIEILIGSRLSIGKKGSMARFVDYSANVSATKETEGDKRIYLSGNGTSGINIG